MAFEDLNIVSVSGNLTRDSDLRATGKGTPVLQFSIASNRRQKDATGQYVDVPNFFDCSMFGSRAEALHKYLTKGTRVCITGELRFHSWTDKNTGQKRSKVEIIPEKVIFNSKRDSDSGASYAGSGEQVDYYNPTNTYVDQQTAYGKAPY